MNCPSISDIEFARQRIASKVRRTRLTPSFWGEGLYLKYEHEQITGSFKVRGAMNKILSLNDSERAKGVIACSAGNHAQGVAYAARHSGIDATLVMPLSASLVKLTSTRALGAQVIQHGEFYDEAYGRAQEEAERTGATFVHAFADPAVMAGQGTIGLELLEDLSDLSQVVVPLGGGGLISGVAVAVKSKNPRCRVVGVVSAAAPGMQLRFLGTKQSFHGVSGVAGPPVTIADGIAVKTPNEDVFTACISKWVDDIVAVTDDEIGHAIFTSLEQGKTVLEGAGAAALAAITSGKVKTGGRKTVVILSGGNIDLNTIERVIELGQRSSRRTARLAVVAIDRPGSLFRLTEVLARSRANILDVQHDRVSPNLGLRETRIDLLVEISGSDHCEEVKRALAQAGFRLVSAADAF